MSTIFCSATHTVSAERTRQPCDVTPASESLAVWLPPCMISSGPVRVSYVHADDRPLARPPSRSGGWVVDPAGFRRLVDMEVQKAQRLRYSLAVLCFAAGRNGFDVEPSAAPLL